MAITKLRAQTTHDNMEPLLAILQEHAVPKYFDRVELVDNTASAKGDCDKYYISCYVGELEFLRIYNGMAYYTNGNLYGGIVVTRSNGGTLTARTSRTSTKYLDEIGYVWMCDNMMWFNDFFAVAKDKNGNTAVVCTSGLDTPSASTATWAPYVITPDSTSNFSYTITYNNQDSVNGKYGLMPIYAQNSVVDNVWFPVLRMYNDMESPVSVGMDGKTYMANRVLVALDE